MRQNSGVTYDDVAKAALAMITKGITPSNRNVQAVVGGKTERISEFLRDFNVKRQAEVDKMADELGSSAIAKLLANEMQTVVDRRTKSLVERCKEQQESIDELIDLLKEKEAEYLHRAELAEAQATQAINEAKEKVQSANDKAEAAFAQVAEYKALAEEAKKKSDQDIAAIQQKSDLLIENAKTEANCLVVAADKRSDKAEDEAKNLREQVSKLTVEQAKREIEQDQLRQATADLTKANKSLAEAKASISHLETDVKKNADTAKLLAQSQSDLAEARVAVGRLEAKFELVEKENNRTLDELKEAKADAKKFGELQGQLVEMQKQLTQAKTDLDKSEHERKALVAAFGKNK